MNSEIKKLWVAALRSGKYRKAIHGLRENKNFCVLGVLCDVHAKVHENKWAKIRRDGKYWMYFDEDTSLPVSVMSWAGLHDSDPTVEADGRRVSLPELNDDTPLSFRELSNLIEASL